MRRLGKISISLLIILVLLTNQVTYLGLNLVSFANDSIELRKTNNENIRFASYFGASQSSNLTTQLNNLDLILSVDIEVVKDGYFYGKLNLENSNFEFVEANNIFVNTLTKNEIVLNKINCGQTAHIDIKVKPITSSKMNKDDLCKTSVLKLTGDYSNKSDKAVEIHSEDELTLNLVSDVKDNDLIFDSEVITNKVETYNGEMKRIIQIKVEAGIANNAYPIKNIKFEMDSLDSLNKGEVLYNTNLVNMTNVSYIAEQDKDVFYMENKDGDMINFVEQGNDELIITYLFNKDIDISSMVVNSNVVLELMDGNVLSKNISYKIDEILKDNIITIKENTQNQLYKSKLNIGENLEYLSDINILINLNNVAQGINFENVSLSQNYIKEINLTKTDLLEYFGENGSITFKFYTNGNKVFEQVVNNATVETDGVVKIILTDDIDKVEVATTKPLKVGSFKINVLKVVKSDNTSNSLVSTISGRYITPGNTTQTVIEDSQNVIELKDSTTKAKLEINRGALSSVNVNENVEMKVTLQTNGDELALFKNPVVSIELPEDVENIEINSVNMIYSDGLEIVSTNVEGKKIIVELAGQNTEHSKGLIEGTVISIDANISLKRTTISKTEEIVLNYVNNAKNVVYDSGVVGTMTKEIKFVSPTGLITILDMPGLGIETTSNNDTVEKTLMKNADTIQTNVSNTIVNNDNVIRDVIIIGNLANSGTLKTQTLSPISLNGTQGVVYYSENANATSLDEYTTTYTQNCKKYIIRIEKLENGESLTFDYDIEIPANLEYGMEDSFKYDVSYLEDETGIAQNISSTNVKLTTGNGPVIEATLVGKSGTKMLTSEDVLKQGQVVTYTTTIKNTGSKEAKDVNVNTMLSENMEQTSSDETVIEVINPGEEKTVSVNAKVKEDVAEDETVEVKSEVSYDDQTKTSNTISNGVETGVLSVELEHMEIDSGIEQMYSGANTRFSAKIKNISSEKIDNAKLIWNLPKEITIQNMFYQDGRVDDLSVNGELYTKNELTLKTLNPGETVEVVINAYISPEVKQGTEVALTVSVEVSNSMFNKTVYNSNEVVRTIKTLNNINVTLEANNENDYVYPGDVVNYTITVESKNDEAVDVYVSDVIPSQLSVKSSSFEDLTNSSVDGNSLNGYFRLESGATQTLGVSAVVNNRETTQDIEEVIQNVVEVQTQTANEQSNTVVHNLAIKSYLTQNENTSSNVNSQNSSNVTTISSSNKTNSTSKTYSISGYAFEDKNGNGLFDNTENKLENIKAYLVKKDSNDILKTVTTSSDGSYKFEGVENGDYTVVFDYDNSIYKVTTYASTNSSKASKVLALEKTLNNSEKLYGVTDLIEVNDKNVANINLGLVQNKKFDLQLDKYISKITVINSSGTKNYTYDNNAQLAKVELDQKQLLDSTVAIEYVIKITNKGELAGYVKNVVDYLPQDMTFTSESNKDWYKKDDYVYSTSLANQKINAGETKTLKLVLTKKMTSNNIGRVSNSAELYSVTNDLGIEDVNSKPANRSKDENDYSTADAIISIKTGETEIAIFIVTSIVIVGVAGYIIVKNKKLKDLGM